MIILAIIKENNLSYKLNLLEENINEIKLYMDFKCLNL